MSLQQESKSAAALVELREKFLDYSEKNAHKVHKRDLTRLTNDDWYLKRYLLARRRHVDETLDMLKSTMEWRLQFGLHSREDSSFPQELYKVGALFPYENDKKGNTVIYMRVKLKKKIDELLEIEKQFLVHIFEKIDCLTNGNGLVILIDFEGAGYSNWDLQSIKFLINFTKRYAPVGLQYVVIYKLPWLLSGMWGLVKKSLPEYVANRIRLCDENSITEFIDRKNLPDYMGGTCRRNYRWFPKDSPTLFQYAKAHDIPDEVARGIMEQFQKYIDEADEQLQNSTYIDPPYLQDNQN